jgi:hypothetical protein
MASRFSAAVWLSVAGGFRGGGGGPQVVVDRGVIDKVEHPPPALAGWSSSPRVFALQKTDSDLPGQENAVSVTT